MDYMITIMKMVSVDKIMRKFPLMKMSASDLGVPSVDDPNSTPTSVSIKLTLDRNDVTLIPGDRYMVDISVEDRAGNPNDDNPSIEYERALFIMSSDLGDELANVDCGAANSSIPNSTDSDQDGDGIASAYELSIGTGCTDGGEYDYIGSADPAVFAEIELCVRR